MAIIEVEHLTKEYRLGQMESLKTQLLNQVRRLTRQPLDRRGFFKALNDVSFTIEEGEVVGIIGHNGAGKSTLLKVISRITEPTEGKVSVQGRISPLIEVSAGFVPDMTGRENIYLNAAILGMSRKAIARKLDDIIAFSETERFIDTPIKRFSSGMKVKLGFAVATNLESEILIVDEVLAVGDLAFQRKCFDRMEHLIKNEGRTVLVVSHNIRQIERLCSRALLLNHGRVVSDGDAKEICDQYYRESNERILAQSATRKVVGGQVKKRGIELRKLALLTEIGKEVDELVSAEAVRIRAEFWLDVEIPLAEIIIGIQTTDFFYVGSVSTADSQGWITLPHGLSEVECHIPELPVLPGAYSLRVVVRDDYGRELFLGEMLKNFMIAARPGSQQSWHSVAGRGVIPLLGDWRMDTQAVAPEPSDQLGRLPRSPPSEDTSHELQQ